MDMLAGAIRKNLLAGKTGWHSEMNSKPVVLCFSGLDPTGGAGIQADIEAIAAQQCHAASIITALTVQDTKNVQYYESIDAQLLLRQARVLLRDIQVSAIKIGMLGNTAIAEAIHELLAEYSDIPVIVDPILAAGGGTNLATSQLLDTINTLILPHTLICTPNTLEACRLGNCATTANMEDVIKQLAGTGIKYILLTGTHADTHDVQHHLYDGAMLLQTFTYKRLPHEYHGSGCTLAASLAAFIAKKLNIIDATQHALDYTYNSLIHAHAPGKGQYIPDRLHGYKSESIE
jgi:hydroxymethylpyrimidine/phosphomethylpyrimidine kinase